MMFKPFQSEVFPAKRADIRADIRVHINFYKPISFD